ncbi:MAG TPA: type II secretion system protein [Candidatus Polarisedimenticolaceae bacterium]|nr:type II secretion system protein [Candidatus Polarisedimenticolaceae bacterium]
MQDKAGAGRRREAGFTIIEVLIVLVFISIIAAIAIQTSMYAFDVSRLSRSVANIRQVANALVEYESANDTLPAGGLQPVSAIVATLGPFGRGLDVRDGWGHDLYYEPVTLGTTPSFRVYCYGKDGTPDGSITGVWLDFFSDVVQEGGNFLQTKW